MQFAIPYKDIIALQLDAKNITYKLTSDNDNYDIYIVNFNAKGFTPLSTMIKKSTPKAKIEEELTNALSQSAQGCSYAEIAYLEEHFALADCTDYYVELDSNAYLIYVRLSPDTEIYGAIGKNFNMSQAGMFFSSKRSKVNPKDTEAINMLRSIEKNILHEKMAITSQKTSRIAPGLL